MGLSFCETVILSMVVLLKNAVLWVSFVQIGSYGLFGFKYKEEWKKKKNTKKQNKLFLYFKNGLSRKKRVMWVVGLTDNWSLWVVGLNNY